VPVTVSVIGTPSQGLGFPGVNSKVPVYLKVIGTLTVAAAGTANSAAHRSVAASVINRETVDMAFPPVTLFLVARSTLPSSTVATFRRAARLPRCCGSSCLHTPRPRSRRRGAASWSVSIGRDLPVTGVE
jgi:hypothetical protein